MLLLYPLYVTNWGVSQGNTANIGLIARRPEYLPVLRAEVTEARVAELFKHNLKGSVTRCERHNYCMHTMGYAKWCGRFDLPGTHSMNFVLTKTLGGGGTSSLHGDPLAKTYGQVLLSMEIEAPAEWANTSRLAVPRRISANL